MEEKRVSFDSKFGIIMAAAGSAVGLGNIWRFPVETGNNGGAAFLLIYLISIILLGLPLMVAEFFVGRHAHSNTATAYRKLTSNPFWGNIGFIGVIGATLILSYYVVVAGWVLRYTVLAADNTLGSIAASDYAPLFGEVSSNTWSPWIYMLIFTLLCHTAIAIGVQKGIEKLSKIFMPVLFVILIILAVFALFAPGAGAGLEFLFKPDFSKISSKSVLSAIGQSFYSLSLCMGCLCTYASYFGKDVKIVNSAISIAIIDTIVAVMAGVIIFPAVFTAGIQPEAGPALVFIALPNAFQQAFGEWPIISYIVSVLFYILLTLATLTSAISLHEVPTAYISEAWHVKRKYAAIIVTAICIVLGTACSLSMGVWSDYTLFDKNIFDIFDYTTTVLMLPLCGIFIAIFIGWRVKKSIIKDELTNQHTIKGRGIDLILWLLKFVAPVLLILAFLNGIGAFNFFLGE